MHIPKSETHDLHILSFEEAKRESISERYDRSKWLYIPDFYTEYRYVLGTRGEYPVICVGINPSTAEPDNLDPTLKSVARIASANGYDSWMMINVYAQRATKPDDMDQERNERLHMENLLAFRALLTEASEHGKAPVVWAAWGTIIEKRPWLRNCVSDMEAIAEEYHADWVCAGKLSAKGHPHHPLYLKKNEVYQAFDIRGYLA